MKRKSIKTTAIATAVLLASIVTIPLLVNIDQFRPQLESKLKSALGREVHLGHMELSLLSGGARVEKISVADDPAFSKETFFQAKSLAVGVSWFSLIFSHSLHVTSLTIEEPTITAIQSQQGKWNFASLGNMGGNQQDAAVSNADAASSMSIVLDQIKISNATVELVSGPHASQRTSLKSVNVELKNVSLNSAISVAISAVAGAGKLKIEGQAGPIKSADADEAASPAVHVKLTGSHVPLDSVEAFLPTLGIALPGGSKFHGGTVGANLSLDGPMDHLVTSGTVEIAKAHLKGFDLAAKLSQPGMNSSSGSSELAIMNLSTHLRVAPDGTHISGLNGQFGGIGGITGDGEVSASNHLQFKMVAHVPSDGAVRFGLNHLGLKSVPNDIPFQVVGTTAVPIVIPELNGLARNTAKAVATAAGKSALQKVAANRAPATAQPANTKKGGFLHNLFRSKDKQANAANGTQLASQNSKF
jgi:AsmA family